MKKNIENSDHAEQQADEVGAAQGPQPKIEKGISGWRWRRSMMRNATSRITATPISSIVLDAPQPTLTASTIA